MFLLKRKIDFRKLRHEWKSFAVAVCAIFIGLYDGIISAALDWTPFIPERWRPYAPFIVGFAVLLARRWVDRQDVAAPVQPPPEPSDVSDNSVQQER